jgi:hypothetical protein
LGNFSSSFPFPFPFVLSSSLSFTLTIIFFTSSFLVSSLSTKLSISFFSLVIFSTLNLLFSWDSSSKIGLSFPIPLIFIIVSETIERFLFLFNTIFFLRIFFVVILMSFLVGEYFLPCIMNSSFLETKDIFSLGVLLILITSLLIFF